MADSADNPPSAPRSPEPSPTGRRGFFGDALREMLAPVAGIIEKRLTPVLHVLETLPEEAQRMLHGGSNNGPRIGMDQPQLRSLELPLATSPRALPTRFTRPPGAMDPGAFEQVCSQCGQCVEACPAHAIQIDKNGLAAEGFPYIVARDQPCVLCESLACMKSCPSGALKLVQRFAIRMGTAEVDSLLCLRNAGEDCTLCLDVCPVNAEAGAAPALVINATTGRVRVRKNACIGCGLCESRCPTEPAAITILPATPDMDIIVS